MRFHFDINVFSTTLALWDIIYFYTRRFSFCLLAGSILSPGEGQAQLLGMTAHSHEIRSFYTKPWTWVLEPSLVGFNSQNEKWTNKLKALDWTWQDESLLQCTELWLVNRKIFQRLRLKHLTPAGFTTAHGFLCGLIRFDIAEYSGIEYQNNFNNPSQFFALIAVKVQISEEESQANKLDF